MKISIITVVYNNVTTLGEAIESVLQQTYSNIEYIIIDGGSTDGTIDVIKKYSNRISRWTSGKDKGIYDAMNKGISLSSGDIIGILNSDDLFANNEVLKDVANEFINDSGLSILYGNLTYVSQEDIDKTVRTWRSKKYYPEFFEDGHVPPHPTLYLKKEVYQKVGKFDLKFRLAADYEFMLRLFKKYNYKSIHIDRQMVKMRLGGATSKNWYNRIVQNKEILKAWKYNNLKAPILLMPCRIIKRLKQFI